MLRTSRYGFVMCLSVLLIGACQPDPESLAPTARVDTALLDNTLSDLVDDNAVVGVAALIFLEGEEIYYGSAGMADQEANRAWQRNTLVTIYSMTKPITGVTLMSLYEEGLFDLEDPLAQYLPEYAETKVFSGVDDEGEPILEAPRTPIKVIDIFRQTACFGYGWEDHPSARLMNAAEVLNPSKPLAQFSQELAEIPLFCHPGEQWKYGVAVDVQARLAEVVAGRPFEELIHERVLDPLEMSDTAYLVPAEDKSRLAAVYRSDGEDALSRVPDTEVYGFTTEKPVQINGGHGLVSSIDDYMRFAEMLQNEGTLDGVQILKPETVALMSRDHLPEGITEKDFLPSKGQMGFGIDFAVRIAPPIDDQEPFGIVGEFFWDGAASPLFWVDPENDLTVVFMTQVLPFNGDVQARFRRAVYDALDTYSVPAN